MWGIPFLSGMVQSFNLFYHCSFFWACSLWWILFFPGFGSIKKSECTEGRGTVSRDRGLGEDRGSSDRISGRRSVWPLEGSYITFPHVLCPTHPKNPATPQLPPSPNHPLRSLKLYLKLPLLQIKKPNWHWKFPPQLFHKLSRWLSLPTWHPFACSWEHHESL